MEPLSSNEYDAVVQHWREWQSYPWGKLLYTVSRHNLQQHLNHYPLQILDVGGGNGLNAIYLAQQGHAVTLLDYSPAMLSEARQAAENAGVIEKITFFQADVEAVQDLFQQEQFDLILCHLMIEFVTEPVKVLQKICSLITPNGHLSILDANRYSEVYRIAHQTNDLSAASHTIDTRKYYHPWFNRFTPLYSSAEMIGILKENGCVLAGDYGIRCICDYLPNEPKYEAQFFDALEKLELKLTNTYPYNLLARFYQVIMQKKP